MKSKTPYYLGLDIGTDSIGYAVTDESYKLLRFKGLPMWGSCLFDAANGCLKRRGFRTARRRLDRRQQRVRLLREFFASAVAKVDPQFFVRIRESALFAEDRTNPLDNQTLFNDPAFKDADFHHRYPTIHHLIVDLMNDPSPHDPRLVYIACAWLVAHRGHFLSEVSVENTESIDDVSALYDDLMCCMAGEVSEDDGESEDAYEPMWQCNDKKAFGDILAMRASLSVKREKMYCLLWNGKKPKSEHARYNRVDVISLLCGLEEVKPASLFINEDYKDYPKLGLGADEEKLEAAISELGDDGMLIRKLKALYDWAVLRDVRRGSTFISEAKVAIYDQHRKDLDALKACLRRHDPKLYRKVFVLASNDEKIKNYPAYVYNAKGVKRATKEEFSKWLADELKSLVPDKSEEVFYEDMMNRLSTCTFLPKQIDGENRVIPHQLYQVELRKILANAAGYLPFLSEKDEYGTVAQKIESVFAFRVPYFVGPLVSPDEEKGKFAWMVRRQEGVIRPWNFKDLVDLDKSEDEFIARMTNTCTYIPGEDVLPAESLLYKEYALLNEINPLTITEARITSEVKGRIVSELFRKKRKVSRKIVKTFLVQENLMHEDDELGGIDEEIKSNLSSYHEFKPWLDNGILTNEDVESIILRSTCTEDARRLKDWLERQPFAAKLTDGDKRKIAQLKHSEFGRLSQKFLNGVTFMSKETGEKGTVIEFMRHDNVILMELLSDRYTLREELDRLEAEYYSEHGHGSLDDRLSDMYVSSAVKRQIYRALDIVKTVCKVMGQPPKKVFVEMARGASPDQKGKRTKKRYDVLMDLYRKISETEVKDVNKELEKMGDNVHNRLQSDALFLWALQLGHCAYCNGEIDVEDLKVKTEIDHIIPRCKKKDDSVLMNKVLSCNKCNGQKTEVYPVPDALRQEALWKHWHDCGLMTDEKYSRLCRIEPLSDNELMGFINRQLVETRQTTKAIFTILKEKLVGSEIIAVKAGNVSEFRQEFQFPKSRAVNDLHHAKDAYLNIVVGNVYHERFSRQYFRLSEGYSLKVGTLFGDKARVENAHGVAWDGYHTLEQVRRVMMRNDIHLTKYAYYAKGKFFEITPSGPKKWLIPRKKELPIERYGGHASPTIMGFVLVKYLRGKKVDVALVPVSVLDMVQQESTLNGPSDDVLNRAIKKIESKPVKIVNLPLGRKILKVNTILTLDGHPYVIRGKSDTRCRLRSMRSLILSPADEAYVKRLESVCEKLKRTTSLVIDPRYDKVNVEDNCKLYDRLCQVAVSPCFRSIPTSPADHLMSGKTTFSQLEIQEQVKLLLSVVQIFKTNRSGGCNLSAINGGKGAGEMKIGLKLSNWKKSYRDARLVFQDFSGMFVKRTENLLKLI